MYRTRSTDVWFNTPGAVAAYQPVAAPGPLAAQYNVAGNMALSGSHRLEPVASSPPWSSARGWQFDGASCFNSKLKPSMDNWTVFVRFRGMTGTTKALIGSETGAFVFVFYTRQATNSVQIILGAGVSEQTPHMSAGVYGISGKAVFRNGIREPLSVSGSSSGVVLIDLYVGARNSSGTASNFIDCDELALVFIERTVADAEAYEICRQMAYCHVNPDWSAWGRRRRYYYAPSLLAAMRRRMPGEVRVGSRGIIE